MDRHGEEHRVNDEHVRRVRFRAVRVLEMGG